MGGLKEPGAISFAPTSRKSIGRAEENSHEYFFFVFISPIPTLFVNNLATVYAKINSRGHVIHFDVDCKDFYEINVTNSTILELKRSHEPLIQRRSSSSSRRRTSKDVKCGAHLGILSTDKRIIDFYNKTVRLTLLPLMRGRNSRRWPILLLLQGRIWSAN